MDARLGCLVLAASYLGLCGSVKTLHTLPGASGYWDNNDNMVCYDGLLVGFAGQMTKIFGGVSAGVVGEEWKRQRHV